MPEHRALPPKADIVGIGISMTSYDEVIDTIAHRSADRPLVVAVCSMHGIMESRRDPEVRRALQSSEVATPDGMPLVWGIRRTANRSQQRVYGPELMKQALIASPPGARRHYLYGGTPDSLQELRTVIENMATDAVIAGSEAPPFRPPTPEEHAATLAAIRETDPDVVWIGLGMPKQELWMQRVRDELPGVALIGVGAAFDFIAGSKKQAPKWVQQAGLEWLFRLIQEPGRLWRRYVWNVPVFGFLLVRQVVAHRIRQRKAGP